MKPNKYPACEQVYNEYYHCVLVKEASFGKFIGRCNTAKELLDACNIQQQKIARQKNFEESKVREKMIHEIQRQRAESNSSKQDKSSPPASARS